MPLQTTASYPADNDTDIMGASSCIDEPTEVDLQPGSTGAAVSLQEVYECIEANRAAFIKIGGQYERNLDVVRELLADLLSDVAVTVGRLRSRDNLLKYLKGAMHYKMRHHVRHEMLRKEVGVVYAHELRGSHTTGSDSDDGESNDVCLMFDASLQDGPPTPEYMASLNEELRKAERALSVVRRQMPTAYPTWELALVEGLSYAEIEVRIGVPEGGARGHVKRVGDRLHELVGRPRGQKVQRRGV